MKQVMKLKDSTGWFAADRRMLQALYLLSDGAFKLFVYISLTAGRETGRLPRAQGALARAMGKSRGSIASYLEELSERGVCLITPAANQHQAGEIEISDAFWPYHKETAASVAESGFVEEVRTRLLKYPIVRSSFGAADEKLARELFHKGVTLEQLERSLLLGLTRKYVSSLNSVSSSPIYSLSYFLPLLDEVAQTEASDRYWEYLRRRLDDLNTAWLDRSRSSQRPTVSGKAVTETKRDLSPKGIE
jgi:hypothetical protein